MTALNFTSLKIDERPPFIISNLESDKIYEDLILVSNLPLDEKILNMRFNYESKIF